MAEYIDRDLALSFPFANGEYDHEHANQHFIYGCETYKEWLEGLPIADVADVRHGRWIDADAIESLTKELNDCRNELCLKCGKYKERHLGACDGCRWSPSERKEK